MRRRRDLRCGYRDANCLYYGLGEGTIARIDAGECMRSMTEARARELEDRPSVAGQIVGPRRPRRGDPRSLH